MFWSIAGSALFLSGVTQMPLFQSLVRNLFLLIAGFLSSFFLAMLIDELRWMNILRLRLTSYCLAYVIALLCVVAINATSFPLRGIALADITFGQWFSGTLNLALVYAFWSELFIQQVYIETRKDPVKPGTDRLVLEHSGSLISVPLTELAASKVKEGVLIVDRSEPIKITNPMAHMPEIITPSKSGKESRRERRAAERKRKKSNK